jgi:hypothetical protein
MKDILLLTARDARPIAVAFDAIDIITPSTCGRGRAVVGLKGGVGDDSFIAVNESFEDIVYTLGQAEVTVWRVRSEKLGESLDPDARPEPANHRSELREH